MDSSGTHSAGRRPALVTHAIRGGPDSSRWSWRRESNPRPAAYKAAALPLSYASKRQNFILCTTLGCVNRFLGASRPARRRLALGALPPDLVEEGGARGGHVQGSDAPGERNPDQGVARPGHEGP